MIRKIDFGLQALIVLFFLTVLVWFSIANHSFNFMAFLVLPVLSIWQLVSAMLIMLLLHRPGVKKRLAAYWKCAIPCAAILLGTILFGQKAIDDNEILPQVFLAIGLIGGGLASLYYLYLYMKYFL